MSAPMALIAAATVTTPVVRPEGATPPAPPAAAAPFAAMLAALVPASLAPAAPSGSLPPDSASHELPVAVPAAGTVDGDGDPVTRPAVRPGPLPIGPAATDERAGTGASDAASAAAGALGLLPLAAAPAPVAPASRPHSTVRPTGATEAIAATPSAAESGALASASVGSASVGSASVGSASAAPASAAAAASNLAASAGAPVSPAPSSGTPATPPPSAGSDAVPGTDAVRAFPDTHAALAAPAVPGPATAVASGPAGAVDAVHRVARPRPATSAEASADAVTDPSVATDPQLVPAAASTPLTPPLAPAVTAPVAAAAAAAPAVPLDAPQPALSTALAHLRHGPDGVHEIEVALHPADLGAVQVRVTLHQGALDVTVSCAHEAARDAVTAALPSLHRDLAGLASVDVAHRPTDARPDSTPERQGRPDPGTEQQPRREQRRHEPDPDSFERWM